MKKRLRVTALLLALLLALPGFALAEGGLLESPSLPDEPVVSCEHEFSHTFVEMTDRVEYTPEDADRHKRTDYALYCDVCILCGLTTEAKEEPYSDYYSSHDFENGACPTCGYVCAHENMREEEVWSAKEEYVYVDEWTETYTSYKMTHDVCADCGMSFNEEYAVEFTERRPHTFVNGVCEGCGAQNVCPHDMMKVDYEYTPSFEDPHPMTYRIIDDHTHGIDFESYPIYTCLRCGERWTDTSVPPRKVTDIEDHYFDPYNERKCICGFEDPGCAHEHMGEYWDIDYDSEFEYTCVDAYTHRFTGTRVYYPQCLDCGEVFFDEPLRYEELSVVEPHDEYFPDGLWCVKCYGIANILGDELPVFTCEHANTERRIVSGEDGYMPLDDQTHIAAAYTATQDVCTNYVCQQVANEDVEYTPLDGAVAEPHTYDESGVCTACGYEQPAPTPTPTPVATATPTPVATATPTPVATATPTPVATATPTPVVTATPTPVVTATPTPVATATPTPVATAAPTPIVTATPTPTPTPAPVPSDEPVAPTVTPAPTAEPVAPTATPAPTAEPVAPTATPAPTAEPVAPAPTATPAPTPAPVFTEVPASEEVHGVKAEDDVPMVEALTTVVDAIAAEDETATVQIVNVERVVTAEEKEALDALPVKEQLFTFLSVIGFEEQVDKTLSTSGEALSEPAQALKAQIQARVAAMGEEERAAFEETLLSSFPQEVIELDGVEYTFFVLELEVRVGETVRVERYGFRLEGDEWIFTRLEIAV